MKKVNFIKMQQTRKKHGLLRVSDFVCPRTDDLGDRKVGLLVWGAVRAVELDSPDPSVEVVRLEIHGPVVAGKEDFVIFNTHGGVEGAENAEPKRVPRIFAQLRPLAPGSVDDVFSDLDEEFVPEEFEVWHQKRHQNSQLRGYFSIFHRTLLLKEQ